MFNFVEKKSFFYFSAIVSILLSFCVFFTPTANYKINFINILVIVMLLAMMILYNYEHKEVMKVLLTSFFTTIMFCRMEQLLQFFYVFKDIVAGGGFQYNSIRHAINGAYQIITSVIVPILFINHFILNYNGKKSNIVININKFLLVVMALTAIANLIFTMVALSKNGALSHFVTFAIFGSICSLLFRCMTIVSIEAFINSRRAEKVATERKLSKSNKNNKKRTARK